MDRLNIGRISSKKMDMLQDLSVDFSQLVKKYVKNLRKLSSKDQKAFGKLFGDFKDGLDDLSTNESVNEVDTKKANTIRKSMPGYVGPKFAKKASDEDILAMADLKDEKAEIYNRYLKDVMGKISKLQKKYNVKESVNEALPVIPGLSTMVPGPYVLVKPGKEKRRYVRKMTVNDYVKDIKHGVKFKTLKSAEQGAKYFKKYHGVDVEVHAMGESVNEAQEPEIITQLRKGGYQTLKDPQTGKKHKVDNYSASAIVAVYDALKKDKVKEKFVNLPLPKMVNVAFKAMK